jgi:cytochrome c oxidase subunit 3
MNPSSQEHALPADSVFEKIGIHPAKLGFWIFLAGEIVILGGFVACGILFRLSYPHWFEYSGHTNLLIGSVNTIILLTGSLTVVLAFKEATFGNWQKVNLYLILSMICGFAFLGMKAIEYTKEIHHGYLPWSSPFWMFYYGITGLHGLHVLAGSLIILGVLLYIRKRRVVEAVENAGLYWHFVDLVWLFIFPLFYLS